MLSNSRYTTKACEMNASTGARRVFHQCTGRVYMSGGTADVRRAQQEIASVLGSVEGRDHG